MTPLSDDERERIRETERIRVDVQLESMQGPSAGGPEIGPCKSCAKPLRLGWQFCPYCGEASSANCPRCHFPTPGGQGFLFCPQCGARLGLRADRPPDV